MTSFDQNPTNRWSDGARQGEAPSAPEADVAGDYPLSATNSLGSYAAAISRCPESLLDSVIKFEDKQTQAGIQISRLRSEISTYAEAIHDLTESLGVTGRVLGFLGLGKRFSEPYSELVELRGKMEDLVTELTPAEASFRPIHDAFVQQISDHLSQLDGNFEVLLEQRDTISNLQNSLKRFQRFAELLSEKLTDSDTTIYANHIRMDIPDDEVIKNGTERLQSALLRKEHRILEAAASHKDTPELLEAARHLRALDRFLFGRGGDSAELRESFEVGDGEDVGETIKHWVGKATERSLETLRSAMERVEEKRRKEIEAAAHSWGATGFIFLEF